MMSLYFSGERSKIKENWEAVIRNLKQNRNTSLEYIEYKSCGDWESKEVAALLLLLGYYGSHKLHTCQKNPTKYSSVVS